MPRRLQIEFSQVVQAAADITGKELTSQELWDLFSSEYLAAAAPFVYRSHQLAASTDGADSERLTLQVERDGRLETWHGQGSGPSMPWSRPSGCRSTCCPTRSIRAARAAPPRRCPTSKSPPDRAAPCLAPVCTQYHHGLCWLGGEPRHRAAGTAGTGRRRATGGEPYGAVASRE
jgi:hypothetical protein